MMLGVVAVMLASFAAFFIYLNRRARMVAANGDPAEAGSQAVINPARSATHDVPFGTNPQEGTAQC
jgi:hypothetical protein